MIHPYGMKPSDRDILEAIKSVKNIYNKLGDNALGESDPPRDLGIGGPEMYYAEYLAIRLNYVDKLSKQDRLSLTIESIKRYLGTSSATPLDLYDVGKGFEWRPLESRVKMQSDFKKLIATTAQLRLIDRGLGMPRDFQDGITRKGQKVKAGRSVGVLMYHDWHLITEMGFQWLRNLSQLKNKLEDSEKEQFVFALKDALQAALENENETGHDDYE